MSDIAAGDVTYTMQSKTIGESSFRNFTWKLAFGNASLTYPSGGIPLTKASLGCPSEIRNLKIFDNSDADGLVYKYDFENNKIRIYRSAGFTPAGTVAAPVFTGSALATHEHTFTVTKGAVGSSLELGLSADAAAGTVNNNTIAADLTLTTNTPVDAITAGTPAGTNSAPAFTGSAVAAAAMAEFSGAVAATVLYVEVTGW